MKTRIRGLLAMTIVLALPAAAQDTELTQVEPRAELDHLPFAVTTELPTYDPATEGKVICSWDAQTDPGTLYMQVGLEITEGDEGWRDWQSETPESPLWHGVTPGTQMLPLAVWQYVKGPERGKYGPGPVLWSDRYAGVILKKQQPAALYIRAVGLKTVAGEHVPLESPEWQSLQTSDWSAPLLLDLREKVPTPTGLTRAASAPLRFTIETSRTLDADSWQPVVTYDVPVAYPFEFFRVTSNGQELARYEAPPAPPAP